jgi:hypothetical protein
MDSVLFCKAYRILDVSYVLIAVSLNNFLVKGDIPDHSGPKV